MLALVEGAFKSQFFKKIFEVCKFDGCRVGFSFYFLNVFDYNIIKQYGWTENFENESVCEIIVT